MENGGGSLHIQCPGPLAVLINPNGDISVEHSVFVQV